ncbi:unnamed protein product [Brassicogethes aeneus]|uniref:Transcriptional regulator ATRX n=1 Tax=Brassicogethes aeneus TaxID=1431903 RepID=A0A9P0FDU5_BRAAE|nr:unnamed protein product [Brassicogethes aeneus]
MSQDLDTLKIFNSTLKEYLQNFLTLGKDIVKKGDHFNELIEEYPESTDAVATKIYESLVKVKKNINRLLETIEHENDQFANKHGITLEKFTNAIKVGTAEDEASKEERIAKKNNNMIPEPEPESIKKEIKPEGSDKSDEASNLKGKKEFAELEEAELLELLRFPFLSSSKTNGVPNDINIENRNPADLLKLTDTVAGELEPTATIFNATDSRDIKLESDSPADSQNLNKSEEEGIKKATQSNDVDQTNSNDIKLEIESPADQNLTETEAERIKKSTDIQSNEEEPKVISEDENLENPTKSVEENCDKEKDTGQESQNINTANKENLNTENLNVEAGSDGEDFCFVPPLEKSSISDVIDDIFNESDVGVQNSQNSECSNSSLVFDVSNCMIGGSFDSLKDISDDDTIVHSSQETYIVPDNDEDNNIDLSHDTLDLLNTRVSDGECADLLKVLKVEKQRPIELSPKKSKVTAKMAYKCYQELMEDDSDISSTSSDYNTSDINTDIDDISDCESKKLGTQEESLSQNYKETDENELEPRRIETPADNIEADNIEADNIEAEPPDEDSPKDNEILNYIGLIRKSDLVVEKQDPFKRDTRHSRAMHLYKKQYRLKDLCVKIAECAEIRKKIKEIQEKCPNRRDEVDRLCDLSTLGKRPAKGPLRRKNLKKTKTKKSNSSSDSDGSGSSSSSSSTNLSSFDDDSESKESKTSSVSFSPPRERTPTSREMEAQAALNDLMNSDSDATSDDSEMSTVKKKPAKKDGKDEAEAHCSSAKKKLTFEEEEHRKWRKDPLLRGKLSDSSDSSTDDDYKENNKKIRTPKQKSFKAYEHDSDFQASTSTTTNSDIERPSTPKKPFSVLNMDSNSELSENDFDYMISPKKEQSIVVEDDCESPKKGRRNIRALVSDDDLTEATQIAKKNEEERIKRLNFNTQKLEKLSQTQGLSESEDKALVLDVDDDGTPIIEVRREITKRLKDHQVEGVQFMWNSCYESVDHLKDNEGTGCILAHCMGLGKTFQVITLIHTLFSYPITNTKYVLVVCPLSTVQNWKNEFVFALKDVGKVPFDIKIIADKKDNSHKYDIVRRWKKNKGVLILGYDCFENMTSDKKLAKLHEHEKNIIIDALVNPGPDLVICDEGHLLRSKNALRTKALMKVATRRRIVLTGTPLQNNLEEYYYMVEFVKPSLLGTIKEFRTNFINPIYNGQFDDSTLYDIRLMKKRTHVLSQLLKETINRKETSELEQYLPQRRDYSLYIKIHELQAKLYKSYLENAKTVVKKNNKNGNFFKDYKVLSYVSSHPHILKIVEQKKESHKKVKEMDVIIEQDEQENIDLINNREWLQSIPPEVTEQCELGTKMVVLKSIIEEAEILGDKVLVFSINLSEMDCVEHFLKKYGTAHCPSWSKNQDYFRMDGTVPPEERASMCSAFNNPKNKRLRLFIMSHKVGGLGLNLTAANRVVLLGVNFNPSYDTQSVYRAYRFGQEKEVFVYRLIALGTMEEKIYLRSITKLAIAGRVIDSRQITRHFKSNDLQEMYQCDLKIDEERVTPNVPEDKLLAKLVSKYTCIHKYEDHSALLANRPEEELNESEKELAWEEFNKIAEAAPAPQINPVPSALNIQMGDPAYQGGVIANTINVPGTSNTINQTFTINNINFQPSTTTQNNLNETPNSHKNLSIPGRQKPIPNSLLKKHLLFSNTNQPPLPNSLLKKNLLLSNPNQPSRSSFNNNFSGTKRLNKNFNAHLARGDHIIKQITENYRSVQKSVPNANKNAGTVIDVDSLREPIKKPVITSSSSEASTINLQNPTNLNYNVRKRKNKSSKQNPNHRIIEKITIAESSSDDDVVIQEMPDETADYVERIKTMGVSITKVPNEKKEPRIETITII